MSTLHDAYPEPDPREITRRLRSYMGDKKITRKALAFAAGIGRSALSAKLDDQGAFTLNEILALARALGKSWLWVMTGDDSAEDDGGPDDPGGLPGPTDPRLLLPRLDSNQKPSGEWYYPDLPAVSGF